MIYFRQRILINYPHVSFQLPAVTIIDFKQALRDISKSVSADDCKQFEAWNDIYGVRH